MYSDKDDNRTTYVSEMNECERLTKGRNVAWLMGRQDIWSRFHSYLFIHQCVVVTGSDIQHPPPPPPGVRRSFIASDQRSVVLAI